MFKPKGEQKYKSRLKWIVYIIIIYLVCILQSLRSFPTILGARPLIIIPVVICISMFEGPVGGSVAGVIGGLLWDLFDKRIFGFNALILLAVCCICGLLSQLYIRNNILSCLIMIASALFIQGLFDFFFNFVLVMEPELLYILKNIFLPRMLFSFLLAPIIFVLMFGIARAFRKKDS